MPAPEGRRSLPARSAPPKPRSAPPKPNGTPSNSPGFSRPRYNATGEERQAAQKAFDAFRARVADKYGTAGEKESQTRRKSKSRRMGL